MSLEEIGQEVDSAAEALEAEGYRITNFAANLSKGSRDATYADSAEEAIDREVSRNRLFVGFEVYAPGVEHSDEFIDVSYDIDEDAFLVEKNSTVAYMSPEEVQAAQAIAQTDKEEISGDQAKELLERSEDIEGVFEHDGVEAMIERQLLDKGYDVVIGDVYEDGEKVSEPVSSFP